MIDIVKDTGLSQNAIRGLYYNTSKGIQFETLETICDYLNVEPGDVIKKIEFNYEITDKEVDADRGKIKFTIKFVYDGEVTIDHITLAMFGPEFQEIKEAEFTSYEFGLDIYYSRELKQKILSKITEMEYEKLENMLIEEYIDAFNLHNHNVTSVYHVDE